MIVETHISGPLLQNIFHGIKYIILVGSFPTDVRTKNKYLSGNTESIGGYIFISWSNNEAYYVKNPYAVANKTLQFEEILSILPKDFSAKILEWK